MLGDKLGVRVIIGKNGTACTDGESIFLPPLPSEGTPDLLGLVNGYVDREAAHIRHTEFDALKKVPWNDRGTFLFMLFLFYTIKNHHIHICLIIIYVSHLFCLTSLIISFSSLILAFLIDDLLSISKISFLVLMLVIISLHICNILFI